MDAAPAREPSRVPLGRTFATPAVLRVLTNIEIAAALDRHSRRNWGLVCDEDRRANDMALAIGARILSIYESDLGQRFWIITEADRSSTTVLLPEEY